MGNPAPLSYITNMGTGVTEDMSYLESLQNLLVQLLQILHYKWVHLPRQQTLLNQYMPHIKEPVETLEEIFLCIY